MKLFFTVAVFVMMSATAMAETAASASPAPVEISAAKSLEWNRKAKTYTARGNAVAKQGAFEVSSRTLTAHYNDDKGAADIHQLVAEGQVIIKSPPYTAQGDKAVYDVSRNHAVLTGSDLKIETPTEYLTATEKIEFFAADNKLSAVGSAVAVRGHDRLEATALNAFFTKDAAEKMTLDKLTAEGGVTIRTINEVITGDKGSYDVRAEKAVLTGNVKVRQGENWLTGTRADVDMKTGISHLYAPDKGAGDGRVKGVFYPKTIKKP